MNIRDFIRTIQNMDPDMQIKILEGKKHNDDAPLLKIISVEKINPSNGDGDLVEDELLIVTEPNPETVLAQTAQKTFIDLYDALLESKKIIRQWHGMGMDEATEKTMWNIYDSKSPEMQRLNKMIDGIIERNKNAFGLSHVGSI